MVTAEQRKQLIAAACAVRKSAYVPYSRFPVGAALLTSEGDIITGVNIENASYGLTVCAERIAIFKAVSEDIRNFEAIAVCTDAGVSPCGACRQVMAEFARELPVYLCTPAGNYVETSLQELLPKSFTPDQLLD